MFIWRRVDHNFDKIVYRYRKAPVKPFAIEKLIGFDSEAEISGRPFLFCDSIGNIWKPRQLFAGLFNGEKRVDYAVWNLRYDAGAVLYRLPYHKKRELWRMNTTKWKGITFEYIPHKLLRLKRDGLTRNFWDIMPYYDLSLDEAAFEYLRKRKMKMQTKRFSREYAKANFKKIVRYCHRDAVLTAELGYYLLKHLARFKLYPRSLYSTASIAFQYYRQTCGLVDVVRFWKKYKPLLRYAFDAYHGGKFEATARGKFTGYEYDVSQAYGSEIQNLLDLKYAIVSYSKQFEPEKEYGFMKVVIDNRHGKPIPCTVKPNKLNLHPAGMFQSVITKQEYAYLKAHNIPVTIKDGWWLKFEKRVYPFRKEVHRLYQIKTKYKNTNPMLSKLAKTLTNSLYGKFIQVTTKPDGIEEAGVGWNPIYGAIITANMRIRMTEIQWRLKRDCLAVHTDSILTVRKMPENFCQNKLGGWQLEKEGEGVIIACGIYQIGDKSANRGFYLDEKHTWLELLKKLGDKSIVPLNQTIVNSWTKQVAQGKNTDINLFVDTPRPLDLNCDQKRYWKGKTNAAKLLQGLEYSAPPIYVGL